MSYMVLNVVAGLAGGVARQLAGICANCTRV